MIVPNHYYVNYEFEISYNVVIGRNRNTGKGINDIGDEIECLNSIYNTIEYGISSAFKRARRFKIEEKTTQSKRRK